MRKFILSGGFDIDAVDEIEPLHIVDTFEYDIDLINNNNLTLVVADNKLKYGCETDEKKEEKKDNC